MAEQTFDLAEILAERKQPTDSVDIYLNEVASYTKSQLIKATENAKGAELLKVEKTIAEIDEQLEASKYTVHITAIPTRMRLDLADKALSEVPMKLDFMGRDDPQNAQVRQRKEDLLIWHAQITEVTKSNGASKDKWSLEETAQLIGELPITARNAITTCIANLTASAEEYSVKAKSVDF